LGSGDSRPRDLGTGRERPFAVACSATSRFRFGVAPSDVFQLEAAPPRRKSSISSAVAVNPALPNPKTSRPVLASLRP
jgi:hypothetical protein